MRCKSASTPAQVLLALLVFAISLPASLDRGEIRGTVTDAQGAVVPNATVVVTNVDTNVSANLTTNSSGFYLATELVPGTYKVNVSTTGFSPLEMGGIVVRAGITTTAAVSLKVGALTQQVKVSAVSPLVDTTSSNFSTELESRYVQDMPLQGRDIQSLVQLIPGITQSSGPSSALFGFNSEFGGFPDSMHFVGSNISANGSQGGANAWYLDGSLNAAVGAENVVVNPSPDAVSEFNLIDNGLAAEWGRTAGAVANVVLKSGTNSLHGDTYEYNRNSFFSATNPFGRRNQNGSPLLQPAVNWNDFGGTLGGPVYIPHVYNGKNRTFFFASEDVSFLHERKPTLQSVPLPAEAQGNFTGDPRFAAQCNPTLGVTNCIYDPYSTTGPDANGLFHRTPFSTPVIPANMLDPLAAYYMSTIPSPNFLDPLQQGPSGCKNECNNFIGTVGSSQTTHNLSVKIDHEFSEKHKLFAEWLFNPSYYANYRYPWDGPTAPTETGVNGAEPYRVRNQIIALGVTSTLSPTLVNEARVNFTRQNMVGTANANSVVDNTDVLNRIQGLNFVLYPPYAPVPTININDLSQYTWGPASWQNAIQGEQAYTALDNITKIMGKHTLKGGIMFRRDNTWYECDWRYRLTFNEDENLTNDPVSGLGGSGLAQFLMGAVDESDGDGDTPGSGVYHPSWQTNDYWGAYVQDDFRVTPSFTLNIGLRYDVFGWFRDRHNDLANFDPNVINPQVPYPGAIVYFGTSSHPARNAFPAHKNDLGPRIAFSWSPFGDRKTVVRGGYGLIYTNGLSMAMGNQAAGISSPGFSQEVDYFGDFTKERPSFRMSSGAPSLNLPNLATLSTLQPQFLGVSGDYYTQGPADPNVEQWSLFVQRELPGGLGLSVGYVGTHGSQLISDEYRNFDYVPTATVLSLRGNLYNPIPTNPALGAIYGCGESCPANLVLRPWPQYPFMGPSTSPGGWNRYNALQARLEKHYANGLNFIVAYTFQKNIESADLNELWSGLSTPTTIGRTFGRASYIAGTDEGDGAAENPDDLNAYHGLAPDEIPNILNIVATYQLPFGVGKPFLSQHGLLNKLVGGWKLVQNWNIQSGVPMSFTAPCDAISCTPNLIGDPAAGRSGKTRQELENQWFNPAAFEAPFGNDPATIQEISTGLYANGTPVNFNTLDGWWQFGNGATHLSRGRMPGFWNADFTLAKDLHLTEQRYLEFRWEVFNAFNHQNLGVPDTNWCLPPNPDGSVDAVHIFGCQFGKITGIQTDPRSLEFALKLYW